MRARIIGICRKFYLHIIDSWVVKKKRVIFLSLDGKVYGENPRYILERIHQLSMETELLWLRKDGSNYQLPTYVIDVKYENKGWLFRKLLSASIIIDNDLNWSFLPKHKRRLMIETWHGGLGIKRIGSDIVGKKRNSINYPYDFFLSNSDHITRIYREAYNYKGLVWKCGYPIEDTLIVDKEEREKIRLQYGLSQQTKICLYAPTFRQDEKWTSDLNVVEVEKALVSRFGGEWVVMVRWHPHRQHSNCVLEGAIDGTLYPDMQELVKASDAFISDYSSGIFQAVLWGIPCFIYANDYCEYNAQRGLYYTFDELPFPYAIDQAALIKNITEYDESYWSERWEKFRARMGHVVSGHAADDVARLCVEFLKGKTKEEVIKEFIKD